MSEENPTEDTMKQTSDVKTPGPAKAEKTEKTSNPMTFKEKLCLNISIFTIFLAVLHVTGLLGQLPSFLVFAVKEQPLGTFWATGITSFVLMLMLSCFVSDRIAVLGRLPFFVYAILWLCIGWSQLIDAYPATVQEARAVWVLIATMILSFCASYHWEIGENKKTTASARIEVFVWTAIVANTVALLLTLLVAEAFIGSVKGSYEAKIESLIDHQERLNYILGWCPEVKSSRYCDALKVLTSKE